MTNKLYYGSLEQHMRQYMKNVKLNQLNNQYQLAQAQIVREGEAMQLSRADIQNKIEMMKQTLKDSIAQKLLPPEKVAPVVQVARDQYKPMTASEYENNLRKRFKATGQLLPDFPEYIDSTTDSTTGSTTGSTTATTASSENNPQYQNITTASRGDILGRSNTLRKEFKDAGIPLPADINKKGAISEEKMDQLRKQYKDRIAFTASGLRKRKSKKSKK